MHLPCYKGRPAADVGAMCLKNCARSCPLTMNYNEKARPAAARTQREKDRERDEDARRYFWEARCQLTLKSTTSIQNSIELKFPYCTVPSRRISLRHAGRF